MNKKFRKGFVFGLALVFVAAVVMAAIPTHYVTSLFVKNIKRLSENDTLTIGEVRYSTVHVGGQTLSGATPTNTHWGTALLSGTTGDISWSAEATSGASGWHLTTANLMAYNTFLVQAQFPGGDVSSATPYSGGGVAPSGTDNTGLPGLAGTGNTIYLTDCLTADVHNMEWTFMHVLSNGTTAFYLYDSNGRFNGGSGTTEGAAVATAGAGAPDTVGDFVKVKAVFFPSEVSGWYVQNIVAKQ